MNMKINDLEFDISVDEDSQGLIEIKYNGKIVYNDFELPYDIAENLSLLLSYIGDVSLEDESGVQSLFENGKMIW